VDIYRDIAEDPVFVAAAQRIESDARRWDEIMDGVVWALARNPDAFSPVKKGSKLRLVKTKAFPAVPALCVLFEMESDDRIILRDVAIAEDQDDGDVIGA
jgi:hypothetical protein